MIWMKIYKCKENKNNKKVIKFHGNDLCELKKEKFC